MIICVFEHVTPCSLDGRACISPRFHGITPWMTVLVTVYCLNGLEILISVMMMILCYIICK